MSKTLSSIVQELQHPDISTRSRAVFALDSLGDEAAVLDELLAALATEKDLRVREDITWALVRRKNQAIQPLIACLKSDNAQLRHNAAHTLGKIASALAVPALIDLLRNEEQAFVISKTALALGQIGDESAIPALVALLGHENAEVQTMLLDVLEGFGTAGLNDLEQAMKSSNSQTRQQAAAVLGQISDERSIQLLTQALHDEDWNVRFSIISALTYHRRQAGRSIDKALYPLRNDPSEQVRTFVSKLLDRR